MSTPTFNLKNLLHPLFGHHMVLQRGTTVPIWGSTAPGSRVRVSMAGQTIASVAGQHGGWMIRFKNLAPGGPFTLRVTLDNGRGITLRDIYVGEVWLCSGQSNMDQRMATGRLYWCGVKNERKEIAAANHPLIRLYSVRLQLAEMPCAVPANYKTQHMDRNAPPYPGKWLVCSPKTVGKFSATAYFFARELQKRLRVPIGLITSCYGASTIQSWLSREALDSCSALAHLHEQYHTRCREYASGASLKKYRHATQQWRRLQLEYAKTGRFPPAHLNRRPRWPKKPQKDQHSPSLLYNGMITPLIPFALQGVVWYHGESVLGTTDEYALMLKLLIRRWRQQWGRDLAFLVVQFANVNQPNKTPVEFNKIPLIREAQRQTLKLKKTALIVTTDLGGEKIHACDKQKLGKRLALAARGLAYHSEEEYRGPLFDRLTVEGSTARLHFHHAEGLYFKGNPRTFIIAGNEGKFYWAQMQIDRETVLVSSPEVQQPTAVRFAWAENPDGNLYNKHGLPASPFRTDAPSAFLRRQMAIARETPPPRNT